MRAFAPLVLVLFLFNACYSYVPAPAAGPGTEQGTSVRLRLVEPIDVRLVDVTANNVVTIQGEIASVSDEEVVLSAWWMRSHSGYEFRGQGESVRIARSNLQGVERKELSYLRSGALAALVVLGGVLFAVVETAGGGRRPPPGPTPG